MVYSEPNTRLWLRLSPQLINMDVINGMKRGPQRTQNPAPASAESYVTTSPRSPK